MALPVEILRALMEAGASPEAILAAAEAAEGREKRERAEAERKAAEADEARRARAREKNRERQRRWYDTHVRDNCDNAVSSQDNGSNGVTPREDVRPAEQKKVLEPKKNPTGIITSSTPSGSQVSSPSKPRRHDWPEGHFEAFWSLYPRKTDRKKALVAWTRLHRADQVALAPILDGVRRMVASGIADEEGGRFVPHPTTFINNARWEDAWPVRHPPPGGPRGSPPGQRVSGLTQHAHERFHDKRRGGFDDRTLDLDAEPARAGGGHAPGDACGRSGPAEGADPRGEGGGARTVFDFPQRRAHG